MVVDHGMEGGRLCDARSRRKHEQPRRSPTPAISTMAPCQAKRTGRSRQGNACRDYPAQDIRDPLSILPYCVIGGSMLASRNCPAGVWRCACFATQRSRVCGGRMDGLASFVAGTPPQSRRGEASQSCCARFSLAKLTNRVFPSCDFFVVRVLRSRTTRLQGVRDGLHAGAVPGRRVRARRGHGPELARLGQGTPRPRPRQRRGRPSGERAMPCCSASFSLVLGGVVVVACAAGAAGVVAVFLSLFIVFISCWCERTTMGIELFGLEKSFRALLRPGGSPRLKRDRHGYASSLLPVILWNAPFR